MKVDIPYYIRQVLREQRKVYVPGIGTFQLHQSPAKFNDDKTVLSPPTLDLTFDDTESNNTSLLKYILDTGLISEEKAKKKINQFTQSAFNKLLNIDAVVIEGLGKLIKNTEQDRVEFEPNVSDLTMEYGDLIPLKMSPVSRIADQPGAIGFAESGPAIEESGSYLLRILLLSLLLIALWFLGRYFYNSFSDQTEKPKTEILNGEESSSTSISERKENELEQKYEEIDELIDPSNEKGSGTPKSTDSGSSIDKDDLEASMDETERDEVNSGEEEVLESNSTAPLDELGAKTVEPENKHAAIIPASGECIIVVGSYIKSLNAIKMASQLERRGYKVFRGEYKGFTRVGLVYECADEDLEEYLQNIRKKISKKAWYLDPDLEVPYALK